MRTYKVLEAQIKKPPEMKRKLPYPHIYGLYGDVDCLDLS